MIRQKAKIINLRNKDLSCKSSPASLEDKVLGTMSLLSDTVGATLGPGGRPIALDRPGALPVLTKDGVTVAESIALPDTTEDVIVQCAKQICQKTNTEAGDGTTTAIVLANALVREGIKVINESARLSPQKLCRDLNKVTFEIEDLLLEAAQKVATSEDLMKVAMISSNSDEDIASCVVEAIESVGEKGTVITEEGDGRNTVVQVKEGFPINKGLSFMKSVQHLFINDQENQQCVFDYPLLILFNGSIDSPQEILMFLDNCCREMHENNEPLRPFVIVAHKFSPQVLSAFALNVQGGRVQICPVQTSATGQPDSKHHLLQDLAAFCDGDVFDGKMNLLGSATMDNLGQCERAKIGRYQSVFVGNPDTAKDRIRERIEILEKQRENAESVYDADIIKERIGYLVGGIATIYVGGYTDVEMLERKHRIEDTVNAVRSAIQMGVVPGGGASLLGVSRWIQNNQELNEKYPEACKILSVSLQIPFLKILENAGLDIDERDEIKAGILDSINGTPLPNQTYDSLGYKVVEPVDGGIIDPVKVALAALRNAVSIAEMLMTLGGTVSIPRDVEGERQMELSQLNFQQQMSTV